MDEIKPLSGAEVAELWRKAVKRGPRPSAESCEVQARHLNAHIAHGAADYIRAHDDADAAAAARLLIATASRYLQPLEAAKRTSKFPPGGPREPPVFPMASEEYNIIFAHRPALVELLSVYDPHFELTAEQAVWFAGTPEDRQRLDRLQERLMHRKIVPRAPVWESCGVICWLLAGDALAKLGRKASTAANSQAIIFAALVTKRLGFRKVTPNALAKRLQRRKKLA